MSTVMSESAFLSVLQPNSAVTTYGLPSDLQLGGGGGAVTDEQARAMRVRQQVQGRLAEKSTLTRRINGGGGAQYAVSDYGDSSATKYQTFGLGFGSKSAYMYSGSKTMGPRISQRPMFSSQPPSPDMSQFRKANIGISSLPSRSFYTDDMRLGGFQASGRHHTLETASMHSMRPNSMHVNSWVDASDANSLASERDATFGRQYAHSSVNGFSGQVRQVGGGGGGGGCIDLQAPLRRSLSGTLSRSGGMMGGETTEIVHQQSFRGPAFRTISRINNQRRGGGGGGGSVSGTLQRQVSGGGSLYSSTFDRGMSRAMSIKSMQSVGRGYDVYDGQMEQGASYGNLSGINSLDMAMAVQYLQESDPSMQVLGAAYIQHECYNDSNAKNEVRHYKGISQLVKLFNSENQEVQRFATGAVRNLIYENMENKTMLISEDGIPQLVQALKEPDNELRKNITGILWNLSSKDNIKEKLSREILPELTEKILIPLSGLEQPEGIEQSPSESEIFYNTTGCLRNLSSVNEKTRDRMRGTHGLVDALVEYIKSSLEENKSEDKGVENAACILRNLSYQLYTEMPPTALLRLEGPSRSEDTGPGEAIGCFSPHSRASKNAKSQDLSTFSEVARVPKGQEWLWHPQIVGIYNRLLHQCDINTTTREAAAGALQNITAGDKRWASVLSRVALEQEHMLPILMDLMRTNKDLELRSLTGFLRNLSRNARDKNDMATKAVSHLVSKLPADGYQKDPSSDVVINICGILNNLVTSGSAVARDITHCDGLTKLVSIKNSHDNSTTKIKVAKAAGTVLANMFQYKKLHKEYKQRGFTRLDFMDGTV